MEIVYGTITYVIYKNEKNNFCVFRFRDLDDNNLVGSGNVAAPHVGEDVELTGKFVTHPKYGRQFAVESIGKVKPDTLAGARQYLMNLNIPGLGEKSLDKMMDYFGEDILPLLEDPDPMALLDVPGVKQTVKNDLYQTLRGEGILEDLNRFMADYGITSKWNRRIFEIYQVRSIAVLEEDPYILLRIGEGVSFDVADKLAKGLDFPPDSDKRIRAGILYEVNRFVEEGNTCLPYGDFMLNLHRRLGDYMDEIEAEVEAMIGFNLYCENYDDETYVYSMDTYEAEVESAARTLFFLEAEPDNRAHWPTIFERFERDNQIMLGDEQKAAVELAVENGISVITGGPGTGKTTIIEAVVTAFEQCGLPNVCLCAPTGRAARRLSETTKREAMTIHRLLKATPKDGKHVFDVNEEDPLECDVIIIDEASMLTIELYYALIRAIPDEAQIVIVGDVDQLPPIGAGFVLKDLLLSDKVPVIRLSHIYRQEAGNQIIDNAYRINEGHMPSLENSPEFEFISVHSTEELLEVTAETYERELDRYHGDYAELDVQIVCPMRRGDKGSTAISKYIQDRRGPVLDTLEMKSNGHVYRVGDKVIQVENDYESELYNGDIGIIETISKTEMRVHFESSVSKDQSSIALAEEDVAQLMPAFAITVHKAQGSEYQSVIIPFVPHYGIMLKRNLLYTALTRAKKRVIIVGTESAIQRAVETVSYDEHYTLFRERIMEVL